MLPARHEKCNGLWRSEDMVRLDLILQREALHNTVLEVGFLGKVQFLDLNEGATTFARPFTNDIRRCEEMQRKLRSIEEAYATETGLLEQCQAGAFKDDFDMCASVEETRASFATVHLDAIDDRVEGAVTELTALVSSAEGIHHEMNYHQELSLLNRRLRTLTMDDHRGGSGSFTGISTSGLARLSTLVGVIPIENADKVTRLCYRVSRGNAVVDVNTETPLLVNPKTGERNVAKATFVVISSSPRMVDRLRKLVSALGATIYDVQEALETDDFSAHVDDSLFHGGYADDNDEDTGFADSAGMMAIRNRRTLSPHGDTDAAAVSKNPMLSTFPADGAVGSSSPNSPHARTSMREMRAALAGVEQRKRELLLRWYSEHRFYKVFLKLEKAVLTAMNLCALSGATCNASLWIACKHRGALQRAMDDAVASSGSAVGSIVSLHPSQANPPTYFETNRFTQSFQGIVDSYGMAHYKEVNPGVFTIITFPYLFGIMFGDIGHGIILLLISVYFILKERSWKTQQLPEILAMIFGGRYLLLLMSLFAIYMGFLYNDFFGFSLNIFQSGYTWAPIADQEGTTYPTEPNGNFSVKPKHVYALGLDVAWAETENKLEFYNSVKMKCAVIVGVVQMFAGLALALNNYIYQRNWYKVALLFVPEFVFLLATFGYMSILIVVKWCTTWTNTNDAPSILEVMTDFFLQPGTVPSPPLFKGQAGLQVFLLVVAFLMVPVLLLGMPIVELRAYKRWKTGAKDGTTILPAEQESVRPTGSEAIRGADRGGSSRVASRPTDDADGRSAAHADDLVSNEGSVAGDDFFGSLPPSEAHPTTVDVHDDASAMFDWPEEHNVEDGEPVGVSVEDEENAHFENFEFSEMMIHYIIHTIEYVLSSVSNTASYLRLWALSLAHAQLSEVFFTFAVVNLLSVDSTGFAIGFGVFVWLGVTLGVLVGMEALSAFLHALRLHWVEFQNKFYLGDGRPLELLDLYTFDTQA